MQKTITVERALDVEALKQRSSDLATLVQEYASIEAEKKEVNKGFNDTLKMIKARQELKAEEIQTACERVEILCEVKENYDTMTWDYFEVATGNLVKQEPMPPAETPLLGTPKILTEWRGEANESQVEDVEAEEVA